jgi:hypothetical protein
MGPAPVDGIAPAEDRHRARVIGPPQEHDPADGRLPQAGLDAGGQGEGRPGRSRLDARRLRRAATQAAERSATSRSGLSGAHSFVASAVEIPARLRGGAKTGTSAGAAG